MEVTLTLSRLQIAYVLMENSYLGLTRRACSSDVREGLSAQGQLRERWEILPIDVRRCRHQSCLHPQSYWSPAHGEALFDSARTPLRQLGRERRSKSRCRRSRASGNSDADARTTHKRLPIYTSPWRRHPETARPLKRLWQRSAEILAPVAELTSPPLDLRALQDWLRKAMGGVVQ
jgi:hypothetical protein